MQRDTLGIERRTKVSGLQPILKKLDGIYRAYFNVCAPDGKLGRPRVIKENINYVKIINRIFHFALEAYGLETCYIVGSIHLDSHGSKCVQDPSGF